MAADPDRSNPASRQTDGPDGSDPERMVGVTVLPQAAAIEDYALIGDCHTAALVSKDGSIDWLCWPRFDSPACFAALLGAPEHGRWQVAPADAKVEVKRAYRDGSALLQNPFSTAGGEVAVIDFMARRAGGSDLMRIVRGVRGRVAMRTELVVRFDYGVV